MTVSARSWNKLDRACEITRDLVAKNPLTQDCLPDYMVVQGWPFVVALYSGVEQAVKVLLLAQPDPQFPLDDLKKPPFGHNLERLYAELPPDDREHIELHFGEHWSLHEYDTHGQVINTAADFIAHINGQGKPGGAVSWRYVLVEETMEIPATSLWTMCEIWSAVNCRVRTKAIGTQGHCFRLSRMLNHKFQWLVMGTPVPYDEFIDEINEWALHKDSNHLAAWIDLFVKASHNALSEVQAPERLRRELARMAHNALHQMANEPENPDETVLVHRIQTDPNLTWDRTTASFLSDPN